MKRAGFIIGVIALLMGCTDVCLVRKYDVYISQNNSGCPLQDPTKLQGTNYLIMNFPVDVPKEQNPTQTPNFDVNLNKNPLPLGR